MTKPENHFTLSDEDLIKIKDAAQVLEVLDSTRPAEMTELFYAARYWDLLESLRDLLEILDFGNATEHRANPEQASTD